MAAPVIVGSAAEVQLGPGGLFVAPIGTAEPVNASSALDAAFVEIGWTEDGNEFVYEITTEDVEVAEKFDPVKVATTKRAASIAFQMAQTTRKTLGLALNKGVLTNTGQGLSAPTPGNESRIVIVYEGDNGSRWLFRRAVQSAALNVKHAKAPAKALLPVTYKLEIPQSAAGSLPPGSDGFEPFWVFPTAAGLI